MAKKIIILGEDDKIEKFAKLHENSGLDIKILNPIQIEEFELTNDSIIVEMLSSNNEAKLKILASIGAKMAANSLILSELFGISATKAASVTHNPHNLVGFCMSNMERRFVEIAPTEKTYDTTTKEAVRYFQSLNFEVVVTKDHPGLVLNRVVVSMINEAIYIYMLGLASMEDVDEMMKLGANFPIGPFEYADFLGLDHVLNMLEWLTEELGPQYRPCPLLRRKVEAGLIGKKVGEGFYTY